MLRTTAARIPQGILPDDNVLSELIRRELKKAFLKLVRPTNAVVSKSVWPEVTQNGDWWSNSGAQREIQQEVQFLLGSFVPFSRTNNQPLFLRHLALNI
jgi:hypothetical protein